MSSNVACLTRCFCGWVDTSCGNLDLGQDIELRFLKSWDNGFSHDCFPPIGQGSVHSFCLICVEAVEHSNTTRYEVFLKAARDVHALVQRLVPGEPAVLSDAAWPPMMTETTSWI